MIDLRSQGEDGNPEHLLRSIRIQLVNIAVDFIRKTHKDPLHEIENLGSIKSEDDSLWAYNLVTRKLTAHPLLDQAAKLLLFVDDIDYLDDKTTFNNLLLLLKPFLASNNCSVVLAARTPAYNAIMDADDYFIAQYFDNSPLHVGHLSVGDVLRIRLKHICSPSRAPLNAICRTYEPVLQKITNLWTYILPALEDGRVAEDVLTIEYPHTPLQENFIQQTSNGNIALMLALSAEYLRYMARNPKQIRKEHTGYWIGRPALIDHFTRETVNGSIRILNVHARRSHDLTSRADIRRGAIPQEQIGNSLYVVLLEALLEYSSLNATMRTHLRKFGFSEDEVKEGIAKLRSMRMIDVQRIVDRRAIGLAPDERPDDYVLTPRGRYYIQYMIHWDQYIDKFGRSTHHVLGRDLRARETIQRCLLQFLAAIVLVRDENDEGSKDFKISKTAFRECFSRLGRGVLQHIQLTDRMIPVEVLPEYLSEYLRLVDVIETHELERNRNVLFYPLKIRKACARRKIECTISAPFYRDDIAAFVGTYVHNPDYEEDR